MHACIQFRAIFCTFYRQRILPAKQAVLRATCKIAPCCLQPTLRTGLTKSYNSGSKKNSMGSLTKKQEQYCTYRSALSQRVFADVHRVCIVNIALPTTTAVGDGGVSSWYIYRMVIFHAFVAAHRRCLWAKPPLIFCFNW